MKELPKEIFVRIEGEGEDEWLNASKDPSYHAELDMDKIAGRYELKETVRITGQVKVESV